MIYYYSDPSIQIRDSIASDIAPIAENMRQSDIDEIWASNHVTPVQSLETGMTVSRPCLTLVLNSAPVAMFGIAPDGAGDRMAGTIWLLGTTAIRRIQTRFLKLSKPMVQIFLQKIPLLYNWVDERNTQSIRWLKWMGATLEEAKPFGIEQKNFHYFYFKATEGRNDVSIE